MLVPVLRMVLLLLALCLLLNSPVAGFADDRDQRRMREDRAEKFATALSEGQYETAAESLGEQLAQETGAAGLQSFVERAETHCGKIVDIGGFNDERFVEQTFYVGRTRWAQVPRLHLWISFDDANLIDGLWLDASRVEAVEGFPERGISLGSLTAVANTPTHSLTIKIVSADGEPSAKSSVTVWKSVVPAELPEGQRGGLWHDTAHDRHWRSVNGTATGSQTTFDRLLSGTYRVTARGGHNRQGGFGASEPLSLNADNTAPAVTVTLQPGASVIVNPVDAVTGQPTPRPSVSLTSLASDRPPLSFSPVQSDEVPVRFEGLPPGEYRLTASRRAYAADGLMYAMVNAEQTVTATAGEESVVDVALKARLLSDEEINQRWGWTAFGRVTDDAGEPIANAEVRVFTGSGTLLGGGRTTTNDSGEYRLRFAEGIWMEDESGVYVQAAHFAVDHVGYVLKSSTRPLQTVMARKPPDEEQRFGHPLDDIPLMGHPFRIDFVIVKPAQVAVRLIDAEGEPIDQKLSLSLDGESGYHAYRRVETVEAATGMSQWQLLPGVDWQFSVTTGKRDKVVTQPFQLPGAESYNLTLRLKTDADTGIALLAFDNVQPDAGGDAAAALIGDDPLTRPPVSAEFQQRGREILEQMAAANQRWLSFEPQLVTDYEYSFQFADEPGKTWSIADGKPVPGIVRHGISHDSAVHHLAEHPESAVFRQVDVGDEQITLTNRLKEPIRVSAGNGVLGTWRGFFSRNLQEGTLTLDARRYVPLSHHSGELTETFSQYHELDDGQFVPLAIAVGKGDHAYRWTFQTFDPGLWLFAASHRQNAPTEPMATLTSVRIDGTEQQPATVGRPEWTTIDD